MASQEKREAAAGDGGEGGAAAAVKAAATAANNPDGDTPPADSFVVVESVAECKDPMPEVDNVILDKAGTIGFKYVLFEVVDNDAGTSKFVVRGAYRSFHRHVFRFYSIVEGSKSSKLPTGGGRIIHTDDCILVFGESGDFGLGDHKKAAEAIFRAYGDKKTVAYIPEGTDPGY